MSIREEVFEREFEPGQERGRQRVASIAPELDGSVELVSLFAVDADDVYVGIKDRSRDR